MRKAEVSRSSMGDECDGCTQRSYRQDGENMSVILENGGTGVVYTGYIHGSGVIGVIVGWGQRLLSECAVVGNDGYAGNSIAGYLNESQVDQYLIMRGKSPSRRF